MEVYLVKRINLVSNIRSCVVLTKIIPIKKPQQDEVKQLKDKYKKGQRVRLIRMDYEEPVKSGTLGIIFGIDDLGQIIVEWDCGSELSLIPEVDEFQLIKKDDFDGI
jgi:hypothetical protein